jgi:hypothetical protein
MTFGHNLSRRAASLSLETSQKPRKWPWVSNGSSPRQRETSDLTIYREPQWALCYFGRSALASSANMLSSEFRGLLVALTT